MSLRKVVDSFSLPFAKLFEAREDPLPWDSEYVVIGFGIGLRKDGSPSNLTAAVAEKCSLLACRAERVIFTGGAPKGGVSEAEAMRKIAVKAGVEPEKILCEGRSDNTYENARNLTEFLRETDTHLVIVSHYLHLRRVKMVLKKGLKGQDFNFVQRILQGLFSDSRDIPTPKRQKKDFSLYGVKAYSNYDSSSTQRRHSSEAQLLAWEVFTLVLFKILGWA